MAEKENQEKMTFEEALQRVQNYGFALAYLDPEFQNNFDIVSAAVKQDWRALGLAGEDLEKDPRYPEIVMAAVKQDRGALKYVSAKLKEDMEHVLTLASTKGIKNLQEKLTGKLQVLTVEQAMEFIQEL